MSSPGSLTEVLASWAADLSLAYVPHRVIDLAVSQVLSQLGAARAGLAHPIGHKIVSAFGTPTGDDPKRNAFVLAALTMCLDFDDTVYAGHLSHSTVNTPIAYTERMGLSGAQFLEAVLAANECAARVTAAATLGRFRGQTALHSHLVGAVAARSKAERLASPLWVDGWGIALGAPPHPLNRAFLGSDAKVLAASGAISTALDAVDAARAGLKGAPDILEHPEGFLAALATLPLHEAITRGLGERWHTETLSFKVYPGCAYIDAAVDCAVLLHRRIAKRLGRPPTASDIERITVHAPVFTVGMDSHSREYVTGPNAPVAALNFSVGYNVAAALLHGELVPADFHGDRLGDPDVWKTAVRVTVQLDFGLTFRSLTCTAPIGEALREAGGPAASEWLASMAGSAGAKIPPSLELDFGVPATTFENAEKSIGARVVAVTTDGTEWEESVDTPLGAAGEQTRQHHRALMRDKFLSNGGSRDSADALENLFHLTPSELGSSLRAALQV